MFHWDLHHVKIPAEEICLGLYTLELGALFYLHGIRRACRSKAILFDLFCVVSGYMATRHFKRWKSKVRCRSCPILTWKMYQQWNPKEVVPVLVSEFLKNQDSLVIHSSYDSPKVHLRPFSQVVVLSSMKLFVVKSSTKVGCPARIIG